MGQLSYQGIRQQRDVNWVQDSKPALGICVGRIQATKKDKTIISDLKDNEASFLCCRCDEGNRPCSHFKQANTRDQGLLTKGDRV